MRTVIVIPTFNRKSDLKHTLNYTLPLLGPELGLFIIDDASWDGGTRQFLAELQSTHPWVFVTQLSQRHGCTRARKAVLDQLECEYAILLDDDSHFAFPSLEVIRFIERRFELEARLGLQAFAKVVPWKGETIEMGQRQYVDGRIVSSFTNCACAFRMAAYQGIGGYRKEFDSPYGEENDISLRLIENGWLIRQYRHPVVIHHESPVSRDRAHNQWGQTFNCLRVVWWYYPRWFSLPYAICLPSKRTIAALKRHESVRAVWKGFADFVRELRGGLTRTPVRRETLKVFYGLRFNRVLDEDMLHRLKTRSWFRLFIDSRSRPRKDLSDPSVTVAASPPEECPAASARVWLETSQRLSP